MPDVEPLRFPSREGQPQQASQDQADLQATCSGRRQTCALLNNPSPCVNNALYHIKELKMTVESWCQQSGKYQTQINQERKQNSKTLRFQSIDSDSESVTSTTLFVEGIAISARESCPLSPLLKKINDVNGEVVYLIEHLEADRQYAEEALRRETRRKRFLENKVDCISLWKQQEHSVVVQKEHEACIRDITELKWLLRLEREKLDLAQEKLSQIELRNQRLNEDINFAKKQVPIVRENMVLQSIAIEQLNAEQAETDVSYAKEKANLARVQRELKKMEMDNKNEKISREKTLLEMKNQLVNRLEDLNPLKKIEEGLHAEIENFEKIIAFTEERCADIKRRIPEMMELGKNERDQILQLNHQIEEEMLRNRKLKQKLIAQQEDMEKTRLRGEADVSCMEEQLDSKRNAFVTLRKENLEYEQDVENYKIEISESEKAVKQMREERKQMLQKIIDNDEQWEKAKEELTQVAAEHKIAQTLLEEQEHSAVREEEMSKKEIETMRKDLTGQMTTLELLKGQCAFANDELLRFQSSSDSANQKLQKEFEEASSATQSLETKIEKIKKLIENYEEIQLEHMKTYSNVEKEKELRFYQLKAAKDIQTATKMSYDNTLSRIDDLTEKCNEYKEGSDKMDKIVESLPEVIAEFQSVHDVVEFKNKSAALIMSTLQSDINNCQQRAQRSMQTHTAHVTARREAMENTKESLIIALKDNKRLASDYEGLKKTLMKAKQDTVSALRDKNHAHKTFHCYTQLSLLQKRMHKALVKYFKQRSLYSQAELDRCHVLSQHTDQKIKTSQNGISEEILLISAFLQSLTDDSTTTDDAGVNKQASPDAAGSNE